MKYIFFQNSAVYYLFLFFYYFWYFIFNFVYLYLSKNFRNFYVFLFDWLEILSKNFGKWWNVFQKNIDIWNPKFFINSIILVIFFSISPIQTCQKILNIFMVLYCTDYRFYQRILENSWIFMKKNRDTLNTKHFLNSIIYYLVFQFFSIFDIFFFYFTCLCFWKKL